MSTTQATETGFIRPCPACGRANRVPYARAAETGRCGGCAADLPPLAEPAEIRGEAAFDALVAACPLPVLLDIWAPWCGPCRASAPEHAKVAAALPGRMVAAKLNSDEHPALCARLGVRGIPDFRVFHHGRETGRQVGGIRAPDMLRLLRLTP